MCGHLYVLWADRWVLKRTFSPQLGISVDNARLHWKGKGSMLWDPLRPTGFMHGAICQLLPVVHLGGIDLEIKLLGIIIWIKKD